jgi:hypothetical protein
MAPSNCLLAFSQPSLLQYTCQHNSPSQDYRKTLLGSQSRIQVISLDKQSASNARLGNLHITTNNPDQFHKGVFQNQSHKILLKTAYHQLDQGDGFSGILGKFRICTEFSRHAILKVDSITNPVLVSVSS